MWERGDARKVCDTPRPQASRLDVWPGADRRNHSTEGKAERDTAPHQAEGKEAGTQMHRDNG